MPVERSVDLVKVHVFTGKRVGTGFRARLDYDEPPSHDGPGKFAEALEGCGARAFFGGVQMAVEVDIEYQGKLRCQATHGPSRTTLVTDAPTDNHGKGESFSPTDLVATSLGACILTVMGIVAERDKIDMSGATAHVVKEMAPKPTRRIGKLTVTISFPGGRGLSEEDMGKLKQAARHCPVHASLHPDIELAVNFT